MIQYLEKAADCRSTFLTRQLTADTILDAETRFLSQPFEFNAVLFSKLVPERAFASRTEIFPRDIHRWR